jgi:hypothetical protein
VIETVREKIGSHSTHYVSSSQLVRGHSCAEALPNGRGQEHRIILIDCIDDIRGKLQAMRGAFDLVKVSLVRLPASGR